MVSHHSHIVKKNIKIQCFHLKRPIPVNTDYFQRSEWKLFVNTTKSWGEKFSQRNNDIMSEKQKNITNIFKTYQTMSDYGRQKG